MIMRARMDICAMSRINVAVLKFGIVALFVAPMMMNASTVDFSAITHSYIYTNGIRMHIAEQGSGPVVLLLHGFPELWYSWRYQIPALAEAGFRAVAPDMRGYGKTDRPTGSDNYTSMNLVGDLIGLLDYFGVHQCFVVGHDWGAIVAWRLCLFRPDRVRGHVSLSYPYIPRNPLLSEVQSFRLKFGEGFYISRFQEPGRAEADFARQSVFTLLKKVLLSMKPDIPIALPNNEFSDLFEEPKYFTPWMSEDDISFYARNFEETGFTPGLNYYRAMDLDWKLMGPWTEAKVIVPTIFLVGNQDLVYAMTSTHELIYSGSLNNNVPNLKKAIVLEGLHHFLHEEDSELINSYIIEFLNSCV